MPVKHSATCNLLQNPGDGTDSVDYFKFQLSKAHEFHAFLITKMKFSMFSMT